MNKSGPFYDDYVAAIDWLDAALQKHTLMATHVLPKLRASVNEKFVSWFTESKAHEIPALVLSADRHLKAKSDPAFVLATLERAFGLYQSNGTEIAGLAEKLMQVNCSHHAMLQCMVAVASLDSLGADRVRPSLDARPDLWCRPVDREVGIEVTSHNLDRVDRLMLDAGGVSAGTIDMWAENDFAEFWSMTVQPKLAKASSKEPWILVAWEADPLYNLLDAVEMHGLTALIGRYAPNPSPLSALILMPYDRKPEVVAFGCKVTTGMVLTDNELKGTEAVFAENPIVRHGLWPRSK